MTAVERLRYECAACNDKADSDGWPCDGCGSDVWLPVSVIACPDGVTAADWRSGDKARIALCDSDDHEWRSGDHVVAVER